MTATPRSTSEPDTTSRNDGITIACLVCQRAVPRVGRRRFCSDACRQAAWRARQPVPPVLPVPHRSPRPATIYECPTCETRFLGEQYCPDCHTFCRRVGPGGACPHCSEPVAVNDLLPDAPGGRMPMR
jgi:hypothetical protein